MRYITNIWVGTLALQIAIKLYWRICFDIGVTFSLEAEPLKKRISGAAFTKRDNRDYNKDKQPNSLCL